MEKKTAWQYKAICMINRVIFSVTGTIEDVCDSLERKAFTRWGGYKITNYVDSTGAPWCKVVEDDRVPENGVGFLPPGTDLNKPVQPGDIVYFDWNDK